MTSKEDVLYEEAHTAIARFLDAEGVERGLNLERACALVESLADCQIRDRFLDVGGLDPAMVAKLNRAAASLAAVTNALVEEVTA